MSNPPDLPSQVVTAIRSVVGAGPVALHEPSFNGNEWLYLKECLDSTFVSSVGKFVDRFEHDLAQFTGAKHAIAVVNGTSALHIALMLAGVRSNDEVLVPALTFVATANAVSYCNAVPHFVDSEEGTMGVNSESLRDYLLATTEQHNGLCINQKTGRVIRAVVPMHTFGHPCNLEGLMAVARDFNIAMVEDAAESLGSCYYGQHTGTFGLCGTFSFNGNKTITTGGGGAIITNDSILAKKAKHLTTTAKLVHTWEYDHDAVGYNYRMPNLNAALGCAQLEQLPEILIKKRCLFKEYQKVFVGIPGVSLMSEPKGCQSNYWLQTILLDKNKAHHRDEILEIANISGLKIRPSWKLLHLLAPYKNCPRSPLPVAENLSEIAINIPSSVGLGNRNA
jgi:aminotransferase in exopolysaccharide biosynthesis